MATGIYLPSTEGRARTVLHYNTRLMGRHGRRAPGNLEQQSPQVQARPAGLSRDQRAMFARPFQTLSEHRKRASVLAPRFSTRTTFTLLRVNHKEKTSCSHKRPPRGSPAHAPAPSGPVEGGHHRVFMKEHSTQIKSWHLHSRLAGHSQMKCCYYKPESLSAPAIKQITQQQFSMGGAHHTQSPDNCHRNKVPGPTPDLCVTPWGYRGLQGCQYPRQSWQACPCEDHC